MMDKVRPDLVYNIHRRTGIDLKTVAEFLIGLRKRKKLHGTVRLNEVYDLWKELRITRQSMEALMSAKRDLSERMTEGYNYSNVAQADIVKQITNWGFTRRKAKNLMRRLGVEGVRDYLKQNIADCKNDAKLHAWKAAIAMCKMHLDAVAAQQTERRSSVVDELQGDVSPEALSLLREL